MRGEGGLSREVKEGTGGTERGMRGGREGGGSVREGGGGCV